jgi:hypothetical protein
MQFMADLDRNDDGGLQIMYGVDGRRDLTETVREDLAGYGGAQPVRVGNGAFDQRQNDVYGAALDSVLLHSWRSRRIPRRLWPLVQAQAECAIAVWRQPDQGIWEARGNPRHYVCRRSSCAGSPLTAQRGSGTSREKRRLRPLGQRPQRRSSRTSSSMGSASAACSASTTTPTRSTPRHSSPPSSGSCRPTMRGSARRCWQSRTS